MKNRKHDSNKNPHGFSREAIFPFLPSSPISESNFLQVVVGCRESLPRGISNLDIRSANFSIMDKVGVREDDIVYMLGCFDFERESRARAQPNLKLGMAVRLTGEFWRFEHWDRYSRRYHRM